MMVGDETGEPAQPGQAHGAFQCLALAMERLRLLTDLDPEQDFNVPVLSSREDLQACNTAATALAEIVDCPERQVFVEVQQITQDLLLVAWQEERDYEDPPAERWPEHLDSRIFADSRTSYEVSVEYDRRQCRQRASAIGRLRDVKPRVERAAMDLEAMLRQRAEADDTPDTGLVEVGPVINAVELGEDPAGDPDDRRPAGCPKGYIQRPVANLKYHVPGSTSHKWVQNEEIPAWKDPETHRLWVDEKRFKKRAGGNR